ncbi:uncharacterized protein LOC126990657, partial [Eriocheir sinensis]|uniref:uncharacterized protein LOC126990657 n=1 Tax=Eriocheir sinensis TaxID=95602 RepID=UPI0021CA8774
MSLQVGFLAAAVSVPPPRGFLSLMLSRSLRQVVVVAVLSLVAAGAHALPSNLPSYHAPAPSYHAPAPSYHAPRPTYAPKPSYTPKPSYAPRPSYHTPAQYAD